MEHRKSGARVRSRFNASLCRAILLPFLCAIGTTGAALLSDTLPLVDYFAQQGKEFPRRKVERFLQDHETSADLAGRSRAYRLSAAGIGATMWSVNFGISLYRFTYLIRAIEHREPVTIPLENLTTPLLIGGEIASFVQGRLSNRSDYLLHKSALVYNENRLVHPYPDSVLSLRIERAKFGLYRQGGLLMPDHVTYAVLREKDASRFSSNWSLALREVAQPVQAFGALFVAYAIMGFFTPDVVDVKTRQLQLTTGISLTGFGIIASVISRMVQKSAVDDYNGAVDSSGNAPGITEE